MNLLQQLAEHDRGREAPPHLEARLVAAFRARKRRRRAVWLGAVGVAAGLAVAGLLMLRSLMPGRTPEVVPSAAVEAPRLQAMVAPVPGPALLGSTLPGSRPADVQKELKRPAAPRRPVIAKKAAVREVVTAFFPLAEAAPPFERGQIWRLEVPASTMRTVGLPVREEHLADRVQADVLVDEEGMLRAIRFVGFEIQ